MPGGGCRFLVSVGNPLVVRNEKGKEVKYRVITREGYTAQHPVE